MSLDNRKFHIIWTCKETKISCTRTPLLGIFSYIRTAIKDKIRSRATRGLYSENEKTGWSGHEIRNSTLISNNLTWSLISQTTVWKTTLLPRQLFLRLQIMFFASSCPRECSNTVTITIWPFKWQWQTTVARCFSPLSAGGALCPCQRCDL